MKTLEKIKDEVAKENKYDGWENLKSSHLNLIPSIISDEVAKRYAQEALKEAAEKATTKEEEESIYLFLSGAVTEYKTVVDKESITNIELK